MNRFVSKDITSGSRHCFVRRIALVLTLRRNIVAGSATSSLSAERDARYGGYVPSVAAVKPGNGFACCIFKNIRIIAKKRLLSERGVGV